MEEAIDNIIKNRYISELKKVIANGYKIDVSHLEKALQHIPIKYDNCDLVQEILNQKVTPNLKCFLIFLEIISEENYSRDTKNECGFVSGYCISNNKLFQLLTNYGYKLTQTDLLLLTQKKFYVDNLKNYNLEIDEYLMREFERLHFYPYDNVAPTKNSILSVLKTNPELKIYKSLEQKYKLNPDKDYIITLINTAKATAMATIKYIHKNKLKLTANLFYNVCQKICGKSNNVNFERYYNVLMDKKKFDYDYKNYDIGNSEEKKLLFLHITKNNKDIKKCLDEIFGQKTFAQFFWEQNEFYEKIVEKHNVKYDVIFLKSLCINSVSYEIYYILNFMNHIIKNKNVELDEEFFVILKSHNLLKCIFYDQSLQN